MSVQDNQDEGSSYPFPSLKD
jgi:hypothetical protein